MGRSSEAGASGTSLKKQDPRKKYREKIRVLPGGRGPPPPWSHETKVRWEQTEIKQKDKTIYFSLVYCKEVHVQKDYDTPLSLFLLCPEW